MSDLNQSILIGNLVRDPELKQTQNGKSLCRFSIANNQTYVVDGQKKESTSFLNCVAFGRRAEVIHQYCTKGQKLAVQGRLTQRSWESPEGKRSIVELAIETFQFLSNPKSADYQSAEQSASAGSDYGRYEPGPIPDDDDLPF